MLRTTHMNLYLNASCHHHSAQKRTVSPPQFTVHMDSLQDAISFLWTVFVSNGYTPQELHWALNRKIPYQKDTQAI